MIGLPDGPYRLKNSFPLLIRARARGERSPHASPEIRTREGRIHDQAYQDQKRADVLKNTHNGPSLPIMILFTPGKA